MNPRFTPFALIAALGLLATSSPVSIAQEAGQIFVERVDVNVVNVEVFVTDRDGRHVSGLTVDDFSLFQDGQPVEISNFFTVDETDFTRPPEEVLQEAVPPPPAAAPSPPPEPQEVEVPAEQRLHLVVYVDNFNIAPSNRKQVLKDLQSFLEERAGDGDQVMLVTYNRSLQVVRPFTDDPEEIFAGLDEIRESAAFGKKEQGRMQMAARQIAIALRDPMTAGQAPSILQRYAQESRANLLHTTRALTSMVRSMSGLPGRKALLYLSDGLPQRPGERLSEQFFGGVTQGIVTDEGNLFDVISIQANANGVTLYTLDARGTQGGGKTVSVEYSADTGTGTSGSTRAALDGIESLNFQQPLLELADATGGKAIVNTANFDGAMDSVAEDFDSYYSLGFNALTPGDGKFHKLEVEVDRPGLKVRHRYGFLDKPQIEQAGDRTLASLIVGMDKNPLGLQLQFAPPEKKGSKRYLLPLLLQIPIRQVTLLPAGENQQGQLRIFVAVQDEEGGVSPVQDVPFPVSIPTAKMDEAMDSTVGFHTQLEIRPGKHKIAIGVFDESSGAESFVSKTVPVGKVKKKDKRSK